MSSREFTEWMAYFGLEPWGEERADLRAGIIASTIANVNRDPKKRRQPFTPSDFVPTFDAASADGAAEKPPEHLLSVIEQLNMVYGGKDLRDKDND